MKPDYWIRLGILSTILNLIPSLYISLDFSPFISLSFFHSCVLLPPFRYASFFLKTGGPLSRRSFYGRICNFKLTGSRAAMPRSPFNAARAPWNFVVSLSLSFFLLSLLFTTPVTRTKKKWCRLPPIAIKTIVVGAPRNFKPSNAEKHKLLITRLYRMLFPSRA